MSFISYACEHLPSWFLIGAFHFRCPSSDLWEEGSVLSGENPCWLQIWRAPSAGSQSWGETALGSLVDAIAFQGGGGVVPNRTEKDTDSVEMVALSAQ